MESQSVNSSDVGAAAAHGVDAAGGSSSFNVMQKPMSFLRMAAFVLVILAFIVMVIVPIGKISSTFVYFLVANLIVSLYSLVSLVVSMATRGSSGGAVGVLVGLAMGDLVMVGLLLTGNSAVATRSAAAKNHFLATICGDATDFCNPTNAVIALSMMASLAYMVLLVLEIVTVHEILYPSRN